MRALWTVLLLTLSLPMLGADFAVAPDLSASGPERVGPPTYYVRDVGRYGQQVPDAYHYPIPQEAVTRETYFKWLEDSGHFAYADSPKHGMYGPRHLMPVLAKYVQSGERKYGEACIVMLKDFHQYLQDEVKRTGWHSMFIDEPGYIGLYRRYLAQGGLLDPDKDQWFQDLVLYMNRTVHVWGGPETYWRGPMHRSQGEGVMKGLAALWYPTAPEAKTWSDYAQTVYQDWWKYRDNPPNDTGYYFGIMVPLILRAELVGDEAFFNDPEMKKVWDRLLYEVSPDGAIMPYGAHNGWNSTSGSRIMMFEMIARHTKDGRYRFGAQKLMNYCRYQFEAYKTHHIMIGPETTEQIAVAYLLADDSIRPVQPAAGSVITYRHETLRLRNKQAAEKWLGPLDPAPDKNQICCGLIVTDQVKPHKLILRSGWNPGDFFVLVDLFPRHDPLNPNGILGMSRWGAALGMSMNAKGSAQDNRLVVEDLSGTAQTRANTDPNLNDGWYGEVEVGDFADLKAATFAATTATNYDGLPLRYRREFAFLKNRFLVTREIPTFEDSFLASVGPVYNSQNVGPQVGDTWANTFFSELPCSTISCFNPPYDLLVYFAPQPGCRLSVIDRTAMDVRAEQVPAQLRYARRGLVKSGEQMLFTTVFYPHAPGLKRPASNAPGSVRPADLIGTAGADAIHVLRDTLGCSVLRFTFDPDREEWVVFNPAGGEVKEGALATDARYLYLDTLKGEVKSLSAVGATYATLAGKELFRTAAPGNVDK